MGTVSGSEEIVFAKSCQGAVKNSSWVWMEGRRDFSFSLLF